MSEGCRNPLITMKRLSRYSLSLLVLMKEYTFWKVRPSLDNQFSVEQAWLNKRQHYPGCNFSAVELWFVIDAVTYISWYSVWYLLSVGNCVSHRLGFHFQFVVIEKLFSKSVRICCQISLYGDWPPSVLSPESLCNVLYFNKNAIPTEVILILGRK